MWLTGLFSIDSASSQEAQIPCSTYRLKHCSVRTPHQALRNCCRHPPVQTATSSLQCTRQRGHQVSTMSPPSLAGQHLRCATACSVHPPRHTRRPSRSSANPLPLSISLHLTPHTSFITRHPYMEVLHRLRVAPDLHYNNFPSFITIMTVTLHISIREKPIISAPP